jgi:putative membrane protein insertion efficiency factor
MLKKVVGWFRWFLIAVLMVPVYFYKYVISPMTPASCRHIPSCSQYAIEALKIHGPFKGIYLATRRILKCNPWGTHGYDPVPPKKN